MGRVNTWEPRITAYDSPRVQLGAASGGEQVCPANYIKSQCYVFRWSTHSSLHLELPYSACAMAPLNPRRNVHVFNASSGLPVAGNLHLLIFPTISHTACHYFIRFLSAWWCIDLHVYWMDHRSMRHFRSVGPLPISIQPQSCCWWPST